MLVKGQMMPEKRRFPAVLQPFRKSRRARSVDDHETWAPDEVANTLNAFDIGDARTTEAVVYGVNNQPKPKHAEELMPSLDAKATGGGRMEVVATILEAGARTGASTTDPRAGMGGTEGDGPMYTLQATEQHAIAFTERGRADGQSLEWQEELAYALTNPGGGGRAQSRMVATYRNPDDGQPPEERAGSAPEQASVIAFALRGREDGANVEESGDVASALRTPGGGSSHNYVALYDDPRRYGIKGIHGGGEHGDLHPTLRSTNYDKVLVEPRYGVRRLTPREAERLMSLPDDWTLVGGMSDSQRYKMCGNGVVVNVTEWIGRNIVEALEGD